MKITLYKNCCLNNKYAFVLAQKPKDLLNPNSSPFLLYLSSLTKLEFEIDKTYMENAGTLIFDYEFVDTSNIYEYNYMKVEFKTSEETNIVRYCFIDDIELKNELVYLLYSEDIWHSYSNFITGINPSNLISSRLINEYDNLNLICGALKIPYNSFNGLNITNLYTPTLTSKYTFIVEIQGYTLDSYGSKTEMFEYYLSVKNADNTKPTLLEVSTILKDLIYYMKSGVFKTSADSPKYNYNVGKMFVLPDEFNISDTNNGFTLYQENNMTTAICRCNYISQSLLNNIKTISIPINYKTVAVGTFNHYIPIIYNKLASTVNVHLKCEANNLGFNLLMECQGQIVDITSDYELDYPIQSITAAEYKQQVIGKRIQEVKLATSIISDLINFNVSAANASDAQLKTLKSSYGGMSSGDEGSYAMGLASLIVGSNKNMNQYFSELFNTTFSINNKVMKLIQLNAKMYLTMNGILGINYANLTTSICGLFTFSKDSNNDKIVKDAINSFGYDTLYLIDNSNYAKLKLQDANYFQNLATPINYNVIQFNDADVYGKFTSKIANKLNSILNNGIKIWYKEDFSNDALVVG